MNGTAIFLTIVIVGVVGMEYVYRLELAFREDMSLSFFCSRV